MNTFKLSISTLFCLLVFQFKIGKAQDIKNLVEHEFSIETDRNAFLKINSAYNSSFYNAKNFLGLLTSPVINNQNVLELLALGQEENKALYFDDINLGLQLKLKKGFSINASYYQSNFAFAQIDKDAMDLALYGNSVYKGQTLNFNESELSYFTQNGLNFGLVKYIISNNLQLLFKVNLQLLQSAQFNHFFIENSSLFTEENAEYIDLTYNYMFAVQQQPKAFSGTGFQVDSKFKLYLKDKGGFELGFDRLGTMYFSNSNFKTAEKSGNIHYEGVFFNYDELADFGNNNKFDLAFDSLETLLKPDKIENSYKVALPLMFNARLFSHVGKNGLLEAKFLFAKRYSQQIIYNLAYNHLLKEQFKIQVNFANGAYGGQGLGLGFGYFGNSLIATANLNGLVSFDKNNAPLSALNLSLNYLF